MGCEEFMLSSSSFFFCMFFFCLRKTAFLEKIRGIKHKQRAIGKFWATDALLSSNFVLSRLDQKTTK